ncbi:hypothetical protein NHX12_032900 [Muraenolepis orangiensis]|uniref:Protein FAM163A n=1 Tax=Muraenolepis orangiensis TaxID=630683 RepID=A0A9Q0E6L2_9TELE|nr:hypothetical protein NHX12_032900 [Muraenolepis orangiensis]
MTAGTVVITGGILATVILLCIIAVLCYCRLQPPFPCSALSPLSPCELPGAASSSSTSSLAAAAGVARRQGYCPTCSPYDSPFYIRTGGELLNGGERVTYVPTHYENQALAGPLPALPGAPVREPRRGGGPHPQPRFYTNTRAISTQV